MPALLTRMSTRPHSASVRFDHRSRSRASSVTDAAKGMRHAAGRHDLAATASAARIRSQIVDDHARAPARQEQRVLAAETAARARDDGHASFEGMLHFLVLPLGCLQMARKPAAMNVAMRSFTAAKSSDLQSPPESMSMRPVRASVSISAPVTK